MGESVFNSSYIVNQGLFADYSNWIFGGLFLNVHSAVDFVIPVIFFLPIEAKINPEC